MKASKAIQWIRTLALPTVSASSYYIESQRQDFIAPVFCEQKTSSNKFDNVLNPVRIRGNYENRLKHFSTPEKIFEYFASYRDLQTGEFFMTKDDFLNFILPFNFWENEEQKEDNEEKKPENDSNTKEESKEEDSQNSQDGTISRESQRILETVMNLHTPSFFSFVDANNDTKISLDEFIFFTSLILIPLQEFEYAFSILHDRDLEKLDPSDSYVSISNFTTIISQFIENNAMGKKLVNVSKLDPRAVKNRTNVREHCEQVISSPFGIWIAEETARKVTSFDQYPKYLANKKQEAKRSNLDIHTPLSPYEKKNLITELPAPRQNPINNPPFTEKEVPEGFVSLEVLRRFIKKSHIEILLCELLRYGELDNNNAASPYDVAKLFSSWCSLDMVDYFNKRIVHLSENHSLDNVERIPIKKLILFHQIISYNDNISEAINLASPSQGVNPATMNRILSALSNDKEDFSDIVGILFSIFDKDNSGTLDGDEFLHHVGAYKKKTMAPSVSLIDRIKKFFAFD